MKNYAIKDGYVAREQNTYYEDSAGTSIYQPDVYTAAVKLARKIGVTTIIDIGSGNGEKLAPYKQEFKFIFVDYGPNLKIIEKNFGKRGTYIDQDLEKGFPKLSKNMLEKAVIVCSDVIEHLIKPDVLIKSLVSLASEAPLVLISTPDRLATRGVSDYGPPQNSAHVREWSMEELDSLFRAHGLHNILTGRTRSNSYEQVRHTTVIVAGTFIHNVAVNANTAENLVLPDVTLNPDEYLASPIYLLKVGSIIADAKDKGYRSIEAQVLYINPNDAGQGHDLIGLLGEVRSFTINRSAKKVGAYPFRLTIFSPNQTVDLTGSFLVESSKLIDTSHLADDYLLETLVGWDILGPQFAQA